MIARAVLAWSNSNSLLRIAPVKLKPNMQVPFKKQGEPGEPTLATVGYEGLEKKQSLI